jgi:uncharacterized SAM-binding protein YcdF (DUF218 family)
MAQEKMAWGLFRRRPIIVPTWRGWLLLLVLVVGGGLLIFKRMYPFLSVNDPKPGGYLVIEGWAPDYASKEAIEEFHRHPYQKLFTTGGPLESGAPLSEYKTFAELEAASLVKLGADTNSVQAVPAPLVRQDRTYASAVALKRWLNDRNMPVTNINLVTIGPHARRSRLMFQKAFGKETSVGVIAIAPFDYNEADWWRSSQGFRGVTGEFLAYGYAKILFHPSNEHP